MGVPHDDRAFRTTERVFFRLLSRDDAPELLYEHRSSAKSNPDLVDWSRALMREGATVALAHAGRIEDPRVRGAAHRIASEVSQFLRSELAEKPVMRRGARNILHPDARPPTILSVATFAYMPNLQRERAGFIERLCNYLAQPAPKKAYVITIGRKVIKPVFHLLGNPVEADRSGTPKDLPLALFWIELLARMRMLHTSEVAKRVLLHLLADVNEMGVWSPRNLRGLPKSPTNLGAFYLPLEGGSKTLEERQSDVTFRLALIARFAGWQLEYT